MEKLSSIVDAIKERLTNPLFLSFLISWLCWNWQIPIALIWFDTKQLYSTASWNYVDYVRSQLDCWSIIVPILFALGYTFGMPLLMNRVRQFNAWIVKKGNDLVFKESQESKVSFENYYTVLHGNEEKARKLEEMIENQNNLRANYDKSQKQNVELESVITARDNELKTLKDERKVIADENKVKIDQKDMTIDTINRRNGELSKENSALKEMNENVNHSLITVQEQLKNVQLQQNSDLINMRDTHNLLVQNLSHAHSLQINEVNKINSNSVEALYDKLDMSTKTVEALQTELMKMKRELDSSILDGEWERSYLTDDFNHIKQDIRIEANEFWEGVYNYNIGGFRNDNGRISFVLMKNEYEFYVLNMITSNLLEGQRNNQSISFARVKS